MLLVGAYPASQDDTETFELLTSILKLSITQFVCLQLEVCVCVYVMESSPGGSRDEGGGWSKCSGEVSLPISYK